MVLSPLNDIQNGKFVEIAPFEDTLLGFSGDIYEEFVTPFFKSQHKPLKVGDLFTIKQANGFRVVEFKVLSALNSDEKEVTQCLIGPDTEVKCDKEDPLGREDDPRLGEVGYDDIGMCFCVLCAE